MMMKARFQVKGQLMIESIQKEIDIFRQYSACYGSVFFVMRRR